MHPATDDNANVSAPAENRSPTREPIAIIGMGCLFPEAAGLKEFWRLIRRGEDAIREVPESHWRARDYLDVDPKAADMTYCTRGGFLSPTLFDPAEWGIPPAALEATDTAQLLGLVVAKMALEDAGYRADARERAVAIAQAGSTLPQPLPSREGSNSSIPQSLPSREGSYAATKEHPGREFDRSRTSVILGVTGTQELCLPLAARLGHPRWREALRDAGVADDVAEKVVAQVAESYVSWQENSFPGLLGNVVAGRIANRLNLGGTNCVVDAACASSLGALHMAVMELQSGRCDMALSGGVDALNDIFMFMCFAKTQALSPTGDARPFADDSDGTVLGEGVGILALKRLADAERDGDRVYAVIRGIGASSDGRSQSIYAPRAAGQAESLRRIYREGGVSPASVELVEAHGTGTKVGDVVEIESLRMVYREARAEGRWCAVGSVKSQIGHTKAAAGVAGMIKAALALHHRVLPPTIKIERPNPKLNFEQSPFYLTTQARPWLRESQTPRRAAVSSFGFGGSNFHLVLEEHAAANKKVRAVESPAWDGSVQIIALSAERRSDVERKLTEWIQSADTLSGAEFARRAFDSRQTFSHEHAHRLVMVAERGEPIGESLDRARAAFSRGAPASPADSASAATRAATDGGSAGVFAGSGPIAGRVAFLFPGQGSQYVGMARELACVFPEMRGALESADAAAGGAAVVGRGARVMDAVYPPTAFDTSGRMHQEEALRRTETAQRALGAVSAGMLCVLGRFVVKADMAAGHSYGELPALLAAGVIDEPALHRLSAARGRAMADLSGERGAMLAVHARVDDIAAVVREIAAGGEILVLANRNSPTQGVVSGSSAAIERMDALARERGWPARRLTVSGAFHSPLVADAKEPFTAAVAGETIRNSAIPVYSGAIAAAYPHDAVAAAKLLGSQLARPVDFVGMMERLYNDGARVFVEVGPKPVLCGLVKSILGARPYSAVALDASGRQEHGLRDLARALARLAAIGVPVRLDLWEPDAPATRKPAMSVPISGANYRAPRVKQPKPSAASTAKTPGGARRAPTPVSSAAVPAKSAALASSAHETSVVKRAAELPVTPSGPVTTSLLPIGGSRNTKSGPALDPSARDRKVIVMKHHDNGDSTPNDRNDAPITESGHHGGLLLDAFRVVTDGVRAMHTLQQQTAALHKKFLEGQELAHRTIQHLIESQQHLVERAIKNIPIPVASIATASIASASLALGSVTPLPDAPRATPASGGFGGQPPTTSQVQEYSGRSSRQAIHAEFADRLAGLSPLERTLADLVGRATGHAIDALMFDIDLHDELGIDSITRADIVASLRERVPQLGGLTAQDVSHVRTLRQMARFVSGYAAVGPLQSAGGSIESASPAKKNGASHSNAPPARIAPAAVERVAPPTVAEQPPTAAKPPSPSGVEANAEATLLAVVSELTGYPLDVLNPDMDMEADLGIDSIKRVEILAAVEQRMPSFTGVSPEYMGSLRTLRQILDAIKGGPATAEPALAGKAGPNAPKADSPSESAPPTPAGADRPGTQAASLVLESPGLSAQRAPAPSTLPQPLPSREGSRGAATAFGTTAIGVASTNRPDPTIESPVVFERRLAAATHPFLDSHVVGGRPVLPLAISMEWLGHAALHGHPGLLLTGFNDVRVLRGVALDDERLTIALTASKAKRKGGSYEVEVELFAADRVSPRVRAVAVLAERYPAAPTMDVEPPAGANASPIEPDEIYGPVLFHGPQFRAIQRVTSCTRMGVIAAVRTAPPPAAWMTDSPRSEWLTDPLAVDAALQLGIVWCHAQAGALSLPSLCGEYRQFRAAFPPGDLTAVLQVAQAQKHKLTADVSLLDGGGAVVAELTGVEWTMDANLKGAFARSHVASASA